MRERKVGSRQMVKYLYVFLWLWPQISSLVCISWIMIKILIKDYDYETQKSCFQLLTSFLSGILFFFFSACYLFIAQCEMVFCDCLQMCMQVCWCVWEGKRVKTEEKGVCRGRKNNNSILCFFLCVHFYIFSFIHPTSLFVFNKSV